MNIERPHEIIRATPAEVRAKAAAAAPRRYMALTEAEAQRLESMTENQRAQWFQGLPMVEKLRRIEAFEEHAHRIAALETSDG